MSIKSRMNKIEKARNSARLCLDTHKGRFIIAINGSDPADSYQVQIEEVKQDKIETSEGLINFATISLTCEKVNPRSFNGMSCCEGQTAWNCYHSLGAFLSVCKNAKLFDTFKKAKDNRSLNGTIIKITSTQSQAVAWALVPTQQEKDQAEITEVAIDDPHLAAQLARQVNGHKSQVVNFQDRVDIMRGKAEEGID